VKKSLFRAKRLLDVQHQLYRMELSKLQAQQQTMWQAQKAEQDALSILSAEQTSAVPLKLAADMAASASIKVRAQQAALEAQMAQTLDQAGKESVAKRRVENEKANVEKAEAKQALEAAIDAFLDRSRSSANRQKS
jgi:fructosamine-3-kinase